MTTMMEPAPQPAAADQNDDILLEINNLKMYFPVTSGMLFQRTVAYVKAVDDVSFSVRRGETLGLVGESGCGKTTTGRCILQLYKPTDGQVIFEGQDLTRMNTKQMRGMRRENAGDIPRPVQLLESAHDRRQHNRRATDCSRLG